MHQQSLCLFTAVLLCCASVMADDRLKPAALTRHETVPLSPVEEQASIEVREGFRVELVASEPLTKDPVAIDWDIYGRLWVVEMADYPLGINGQGKPGGRVRVLEDTTGDGSYDTSTLFLDGLSFPTGIITWRKGVLITAAPDLIYAEDTDGDLRADKRQSLFSGFNQGNQQLRMNGLRWGLDNWIHCASGSHHSGHGHDTGVIVNATGESIIVGSRDFRIRPDKHLLDPQSGPSQFGRNRDDWGSWFGVQNSYPLRHYVLADHDIRRNPHFVPPNPRIDLTQSNPTVYPIKKPQKRYHSFENATQFTSACSGIVYRDNLLFGSSSSEDPLQHSFTCAPFHSLVQHNLLREAGTSFELNRDPTEDKKEFFASRDRWCRPVMVRTGPDGALWIVDMYRYMIEHPDWVNQEARNELRPYYRHGEQQGRIWRVFPTGGRRDIPELKDWTTEQLVSQLQNSNGWIRDNCQQLLIWRADPESIGPLRNMVQTSNHALARLHAICTLSELTSSGGRLALDRATLAAALQDTHPGVRRHAARLTGEIGATELLDMLVGLVSDANAKVRLQLANSLGHFDDARVNPALSRLLTDAQSDAYIRAAAMSSISDRNVSEVLAAVGAAAAPQQDVLRGLCRLAVATKKHHAINTFVAAIVQDGSSGADRQFDTLAALLDVVSLDELPSQAHSETLNAILAVANETARAHKVPQASRLKAIQLIARHTNIDEPTLTTARLLISARQTPAIQAAIVDRLATRNESVIAKFLLESWQGSSPALRSRVVSALLSRDEWTARFVDAIESRQIPVSDLSATARQTLLRRKNKESGRVKALLDDLVDADRQGIIETYRHSFHLNSSAETGAKVFEKNCSNCHRLDNVGQNIGPDLKSLTNKTRTALLSSILNPNEAVEAKYVTYAITDKHGRAFSGLIKTETAASITLVTAENKEISVLRTEIDEVACTGQSLMPDGLEKEISLQQMADLFAFLQHAGAAEPGAADN